MQCQQNAENNILEIFSSLVNAVGIGGRNEGEVILILGCRAHSVPISILMLI